jgi:hypothetical protein
VSVVCGKRNRKINARVCRKRAREEREERDRQTDIATEIGGE